VNLTSAMPARHDLRATRISVAAFLRRDWRIARSYRLQFALDVAIVPLSLALFFFLSRLIDPGRLPSDADLSQGYFSYAALGIVVLRMVQTALTAFATKLSTEQTTGTFETLLAEPISPTIVVLGSASFELLRALVTGIATVLVATLFGLRIDLGVGSIVGLVVGLPALVATFAAVGVILGAFAVVVKQVTALLGLATAALGLLAGAYFPIELLPGPLQFVANLLPFTWGIDVLRAALLRGELAADRLALLAGFAVVALPLSLWLFGRALNRARRAGTLAQF
jgi:ABC-2 type transport system permease protein